MSGVLFNFVVDQLQLNTLRGLVRSELERHQVALRAVGMALGQERRDAVEARIDELQRTLRSIEAPIAELVARQERPA